jgi:hypothetical protein
MSAPEPVGRGDALRARVPDVLRTYQDTRREVLEHGVLDPELKRLCARYLAGDPGLGDLERAEGLGPRELAALGWAQAIAWDSSLADDALWDRLHANFSEPELVELGYAIAIVHGQLHWLRTLGVKPAPDEALAI